MIELRDKTTLAAKWTKWSDCENPLPEVVQLLERPAIAAVIVERGGGNQTQYRVKRTT